MTLPAADLSHVIDHTRGLWEPLRGKSVFLTGGTGFVGTWLLASLLRADEEFSLGVTVHVLTRNAERFLATTPYVARHLAVRVLEGDMTTFDPPPGHFPFVIHAATEPHCEPAPGRPCGTFETEIEGTRRVLEFARTHGTRRFLLTSSGAAYGVQPPTLTHIAESYGGAPSTTDPASAYGHAKRASEYMCAMYGRVHGFDALISRLFAFVGPVLPLDANFAIGNFIRDAINGGPIRIAGDGTPYRSYLYAADLAIWLWTILFRAEGGRPYNVGSSQEVSIGDLARMVIETTGVSASIDTAKQPEPGVLASRYVPNVDRARLELGLTELVPLESAIQKTYVWYQARQAGVFHHE